MKGDTTMHALIAFLIFALIVLVIAYVVLYVLRMIPGLPPPVLQLAPLIIGLIVLLILVNRALPLLGLNTLM